MSVTLMSHEGAPISVTLPEQVVVTVVEADAVVKGQTASSSYKPATVDNGQRVMVPPHIETGTRIVVKTKMPLMLNGQRTRRVHGWSFSTINVMHKASMAASKRMMRDFGEVENLQVTRKGSADFVSQADISAERTIQAELAKARPDWGFIMEEAGQIDAADKDAPCWIIDPIDGTTNFLHGIPHFAISIAVMDKGKITAGTVFDPARNEFYFAETGTGAF